MTDAQFLSWLLIALWLYTRALRRHSHADMALGSVAGAAAIGTRQFGLALLVAMLITWLLDAERRRNAGLYVLGLVAPALITAWQSLTSLGFPTFFMTINGERQADYLRDPVFLLREAFWRPPVILEHLCLFLLPILPSAMLAARQCRPTASPSPAGWVSHGLWRRAGPPAVLILIGLYLAAGVCYVYLLPEVDRRQLLQSNDWSLQALRLPTAIPPPVVPLTTAGGLLSGWIFLRTTRETWGSRPSAGNRLVLLTGAGLLALDVLYFQFIDRYLIVLLPFALFFFARALRDWPRWCTLLAFSLALILLSLSCLVIRGYLEEEEARWTAAEALRIAGVEPRRVEAEWPWSAYYGAVDEWIADARGRNVRSYRDFFDRYLPQQRKAATYRLTLTTSRFERRRLIEGNVIFRDRLLQERTLFIVRLAEDARLAGS